MTIEIGVSESLNRGGMFIYPHHYMCRQALFI